jgi:GR25 family glycosyltransferase involved in LPS biosynthesis
MEEQFARMGISAERMNAYDCENGAIGCTTSHIHCIEYALSHNFPYLCVFEDDVVFTNPDLFKTQLTTFLKSDIVWDVLLLGGNVNAPFDKVNENCIRVYNSKSTMAYIVKNKYFSTLLNNFKVGLSWLIRGIPRRQCAIDVYWIKLQQTHSWYMLMPLTILQRPDFSDIEKREVDYGQALLICRM